MTPPRAVLLVANAADPYSRGLRVARSLAAAGYDVEIAAVADAVHPRSGTDGAVRIERYAPSGGWARYAHDRRRRAGGCGARDWIQRFRRIPDLALRALAWPAHVRGWWHTLRQTLPPADLYHAFGILTVPVAIALARDARRHGRAGRVVYDVIDVILESNNVERMPRPLLLADRIRERRWAGAADAVVTVNDEIADHLVRTWRLGARPTVLLNCQPRWVPPDPQPDLIRAATGIPAERRIVLFLGRLGRDRGLDESAEAVLRLRDVALVMVGFGPWAERLRARDAERRFVGHHFTLPAVHPDDVPRWSASADASIIAVPGRSLNQRLSTPNKFWESLTAGTPVVVGRDLAVMRRIVEAEGLGSVADPSDPADLARALGEVLDGAPAEVAAMRERCLAITRDVYNWESAVQSYLELVQTLAPSR
ncbi:MAG: glycosyltransferase [Candidatus Limnocylindrales bacterium]